MPQLAHLIFHLAKTVSCGLDCGLWQCLLEPSNWLCVPMGGAAGARPGRAGPVGTTPSRCSAEPKGFTKEEWMNNYHQLEALRAGLFSTEADSSS
jgi:hypothetical protein